MRLGHLVLVSSIALSFAIPATASSHKRRPTAAVKTTAVKATASKTSSKSKSKTSSKRAAKPQIRGQRGIDDARATQIQGALIKAGYLSGEPSGHWDAQSEAAMQKLQAANGWQTKLVPDSRALIKLGLGPATDSVANAATPEPANAQ
ncbi:MAG TPA: peptidoglycan-binding domain-containing protein [Acidobacteriaceae bacterium]